MANNMLLIGGIIVVIAIIAIAGIVLTSSGSSGKQALVTSTVAAVSTSVSQSGSTAASTSVASSTSNTCSIFPLSTVESAAGTTLYANVTINADTSTQCYYYPQQSGGSNFVYFVINSESPSAAVANFKSLNTNVTSVSGAGTQAYVGNPASEGNTKLGNMVIVNGNAVYEITVNLGSTPSANLQLAESIGKAVASGLPS